MAENEADNTKLLARLFLRELETHKIAILEHKEGEEFVLDVRGVPITISLSDLAYDFDRDADPALVTRFVNELLEPEATLPAWRKARERVFLSAASGLDRPEDHITEPISTLLCIEVVYADKDERMLTPVTKGHLATWQVTREDVMRAARRNLVDLLEDTDLEVRKIGPMTAGTFVGRSVFKPAFVFASNFKEKVRSRLGWPVLALLPCRESVFVLRENAFAEDTKETDRFLGFVVHEFLESRHNLTPEVFRVSDEGVRPLTTLGTA